MRLDPSGQRGPTRGQARNRNRYRRSSSGYYTPAWVDGSDVEQRILEASVVLRSGHAVTGWAALRWCGGAWFSGVDAAGAQVPVDLLISTHDIRPQAGFALSGEGTGPEHIEVVDTVPVTSAAWSVSFAMRYAGSVRRAVEVVDMAAYSDLVSVAEVADVVSGQSSWTGVPLARDAVALADENAWSPREVAMRMTWQGSIEGSRPRANIPLFDSSGRHLGTPDLVDVDAGVAADYDGLVHLGREQRRADRSRDEVFSDHGIEMVRWLSGDRPADFLARLHVAYQAASRRTGPRRWTADPPSWWISTTTVAARRTLTEDQRERLLRYRIA
ncbi:MULTISPECIES: hypothetical protein [unclassified Nocardioides]|uniref:hypothetical protein n=1 Tax=unclassified Nocardioides TaxID=2615069 RepID=UPI0004ACAE12|nr:MULTISPECIES: hypothetical protein [unclassified Nocardioides]